ncbi:serine/threonine protein kinase [Meridianimarinicoccus roseus]|uniref:Serine/threonine protein kinase n=1 Tax=Meridianimarinicoccus roseus TaxID=2072018 RepID=A0A2V2L7R8_9RHOB|nr:serine/threonine-protein kinase [Meridianimarinicoccus roseus]PWR01185.1 serine/threonine protein kinase [Meridianimarinicoccus roseus]
MSAATFKIGDLLNNTYRIEAVLGRGGTSEVYQARSEISGNRVALKVLRAEYSRDEGFLNLMTREEDIREIRHDAIVRYYHNQRNANGDVFLVMDYVDGPGLDKKMKSGGMSASDLMVVAERVAEGLKAAHAKLIVHRDLSPDNIILRNGSPSEAVIIDFGIAKDSNPGAETVVGNEFAGKYAYAAPEQLSGKSDARSDLYALGALLLATFRGKAPDIGNNPLEVIEKKGLPLDTSGVPEPLRTVIDRMTVPDPDRRLQDADALLVLIRGGAAPGGQADLDEATVIAPRAPSDAPRPSPTVASAGTDAGAGRSSRRGGIFAALGAAGLLAAAGGAYLGGVLDPFLTPGLPLAEPFRIVMERPVTGAIYGRGHVPSEEAAQTLGQQILAMDGTTDFTLARGNIVDNWGVAVTDILEAVATLPEWRIEVVNNDVRVEGLTFDKSEHDTIGRSLGLVASVSGMEMDAAIELGPRILVPSALDPILKAYQDCGDLRLVDPPALGYSNADLIRVEGWLASEGAKAGLADAIERISGHREVAIDAQVLNQTLCLFESVLPSAPPGGFDIRFMDGETGAAVPDGIFSVGQNPVIDLVIPAGVTDGYLFVSALDVSGKVFHLMPNVNRPGNDVAALRDGRDGPVTIRLAHTLAEAADSGGKKLAFVVDETALGKTQVLVIHADEPFLDGMRPTTESAMSYAEALGARSGKVGSLDTRLLTTTLP